MTGVLAQLRAVPVEPEALLPSPGGYHPLLVLHAEKLTQLLWPEMDPGGPYAPDERELTPEEAATKLWTRLLVIAAACARTGAAPSTLMQFDEPRHSLGGRSLFEACRTEAGFVRALGLVHMTGGADPKPGDLTEALLGELERLLTVGLPKGAKGALMHEDIDTLTRLLGGRPQAAVVYACHRWPFHHEVHCARGRTLYWLASKGRRSTVEDVLKALGA